MAAKVLQPIPEPSDPIRGTDTTDAAAPTPEAPTKPGLTLVPNREINPHQLLRIAKRKLGATPHKIADKQSHNHDGFLVHEFDCPKYGHSPKDPKPKNCRCNVYVSDEKVKALKKANAVVPISVPRGSGTYRSQSFVSTIVPEVLTQAAQILQADKDADEAAKEAKRQLKQQKQVTKKVDETKTKIVGKVRAFLIKQNYLKRIPDFIVAFDPELLLQLCWEAYDPNATPRLSKLEVLHPDVFQLLNSCLPTTDKKRSAGSAYSYLLQLAYEYFLTETNPDFQMEIAGELAASLGKDTPQTSPEYDKLRSRRVNCTGYGADDDDEFDHFAHYDTL